MQLLPQCPFHMELRLLLLCADRPLPHQNLELLQRTRQPDIRTHQDSENIPLFGFLLDRPGLSLSLLCVSGHQRGCVHRKSARLLGSKRAAGHNGGSRCPGRSVHHISGHQDMPQRAIRDHDSAHEVHRVLLDLLRVRVRVLLHQRVQRLQLLFLPGVLRADHPELLPHLPLLPLLPHARLPRRHDRQLPQAQRRADIDLATEDVDVHVELDEELSEPSEEREDQQRRSDIGVRQRRKRNNRYYEKEKSYKQDKKGLSG